ncbi:TnpV protein [Mitsuokella multacida]|uniref:TnpV protein n=1 Tax=Mitsuokella multacida TaxID=52226 RepID=UPI00242A44F1|nr:TnpV protein [Mitsuokella multacida]
MNKADLKERKDRLHQNYLRYKANGKQKEWEERYNVRRKAQVEAAGVTEELKARAPMRWVGLMNTLKAQAEEIIFQELISA